MLDLTEITHLQDSIKVVIRFDKQTYDQTAQSNSIREHLMYQY